MKKRICIVRHGYLPQDPRVRKEALALAEKGCEVTIVCSRDSGESAEEQWRNITLIRLPVQHFRRGIFRYLYEYGAFFLLAFFKVTMLQFRRRFDVVQVNTLPDFLVFVALFPRLTGAKVILDMHELMPEFFATKYKIPVTSPAVRIIALIEKISMSYADRIIAPSELRKQLIAARGIPPSKIGVVYNSPDEDVFSIEAAEKITISNHIDILAYGTILELYGFQVLIRAIPAVKKKFPDVSLMIIGDGEYLPELKLITKKLELDDNISFAGRLPMEHLPSYINYSTLSVMPILKDDFTDYAAPNKLFEYMAMKCPVICTDVKGIREYVDDSQVLYFQSGDANDLATKIVFLLENQKERIKYVENAWSAYQQYRWNKNKVEYQDLVIQTSPN